jgi:hypothetical protein
VSPNYISALSRPYVGLFLNGCNGTCVVYLAMRSSSSFRSAVLANDTAPGSIIIHSHTQAHPLGTHIK